MNRFISFFSSIVKIFFYFTILTFSIIILSQKISFFSPLSLSIQIMDKFFIYMLLNFLFFLIYVQKNIFSKIFFIFTGILFGIDRYFAVLFKDSIFFNGLSINQIDLIFSPFEALRYSIPYFNLNSFFIISIFTFTFILIYWNLFEFIIDEIKKYNLKIPFNSWFFIIFSYISFFLCIFNHTKHQEDAFFSFKIYYLTYSDLYNKFNFHPRNDIINLESYNLNQNVIFIIDESISFRDFNFKKLNFDFINLSPTIVTYNCSYASNFDMYTGLKNREYIYSPTIFQYSLKQGYTNYYINAQTTSFPNGLNFGDKEFIHKHLYIDGDIYSKDNKVLKYISSILSNNLNEKKFILINKYGAHYPYSNIINPSNKYIDYGLNKLYNDYKNIIHYNSILFLNTLNEIISGTNTIVIYVSDHGQNINFLNKVDETTLSHCDGNLDSYFVPSLIFGNTSFIKKYVDINKKIYSTIDLFALNLLSFGYSFDDIKKNFYINSSFNKMFYFNKSFKKTLFSNDVDLAKYNN